MQLLLINEFKGIIIFSESNQSGTTLKISKHEAQMGTTINQAKETKKKIDETTFCCLFRLHANAQTKNIEENYRR